MILSEQPRIELLNMDCMSYMAGCRDKQFALSICDPPYGIGDKFKGGKTGIMNFNEIVDKEWDKVPTKEYWNQLFRVTKNQMIFGGNYFPLPPTRCFIVWDKVISQDFSLAMAELIWTSFDDLAKIYKLQVPKNGKVHPTQKPVKLYEWLLTNYAKPGDTILDTHGGSFSSAIAAYRLGFDFVGIELDADYFNAAVKRFKEQTAQLDAFRQPKPATVTQLTLNPYGDKLCPNCNRHHSEAGSFCCTACEFGI